MFSYNTKTGNIMQFDKRVVRWEKNCGNLYFYTIQKKCKCFLSQYEISELVQTIKWLREQHGCDFGEEINQFATSYLIA